MHLRSSWIGMAAVAAAIAGGTIPALATGDGALPSTASFTATDFSWHETGGTTSDTSVQVAVGGTVSFAYPAGGSEHNADFVSGPRPSSCAQAGGTPSGSALPADPTRPSWSGSCTFATAGTYTFQCDLHPDMVGTIVVGDAVPVSTTPTPGPTTSTPTPPAGGGGTKPPVTTPKGTPPATGTPTPPATGGTSTGSGSSGGTTGPTPAGPPLVIGHAPAAPLSRVTLTRTQRGTKVRGTLTLGAARTKLVVELLVRHGKKSVVLGRLTRASAGPGRVSVSISLSAAGRRQLRKARRLALTVRVVATPHGGHAVTRTAAVTLRS